MSQNKEPYVVNGWKIENEEWKDYARNILTEDHYWVGLYINRFYIDETCDRLGVEYPNIADHFYYFWMLRCLGRDCYFASYDKDEMKRFIKEKFPRLTTAPMIRDKISVWIEDAVTKETFSISEFFDS